MGVEGNTKDAREQTFPDAISKLGHYTEEEIAAAEAKAAVPQESLADFLADKPARSAEQSDPVQQAFEKQADRIDAERRIAKETGDYKDVPTFDDGYHARRLAADPEYRDSHIATERERRAEETNNQPATVKKSRLSSAASFLGGLITGK